MSELQVYHDDRERREIAAEVKRIFTLKDRPATAEKITIFCDEICATGFSFEAIMAGIRSLTQCNLPRIDIEVILKAIKDHSKASPQEYSDQHTVRCEKCDDTGHITMVDRRMYNTAFACSCKNGEELTISMKMFPWNGQETQQYNGKQFRLLFPEILNAR